MFGFEKLDVYKEAKGFNLDIRRSVLINEKLDRVSKDQLRRASMSIMLNIAEGSSRFSNADERNFYVIARGSIFECVSILELLCAEQIISNEQQKHFYYRAEVISKMLFKMISRLTKKSPNSNSSPGLKS
jgi:four helix bundle protein